MRESRPIRLDRDCVQSAGRRSGVLKRFTPTILRSTYAHRRLLAGHNIRAVQLDMGHRDVRSTLRYKACPERGAQAPRLGACILPNVTSPIDPESQGMIVRQMNVLLARLNMALLARSLGAGGTSVLPTKPQGP